MNLRSPGRIYPVTSRSKEDTDGFEVGASKQGAVALEFVDQHSWLSSDRGRKLVCGIDCGR